jgi:hypothetical protein
MTSHYIMDGGILNISWEELDMFNDTYIQDIMRKKRLCYVERRTPLFKFFIDLDHKAKDRRYNFGEQLNS